MYITGAHITPTLVLTKLHLEIREPAAHNIINPRHMRKGYGSHSVCPSICLSVCYRASCYKPDLYVDLEVHPGVLANVSNS